MVIVNTKTQITLIDIALVYARLLPRWSDTASEIHPKQMHARMASTDKVEVIFLL